MISDQIVAKFLNAKLRDSERAKKLTDAELDEHLQALDPQPRFEVPPYRHQKICFMLGLRRPKYLFLVDMGLGKTKLTLDLFRYRRDTWTARRMLVLVPNVANVPTWGDEVTIHTPDLTCGLIHGHYTPAKKDILWRGCDDVLVVTYASLRSRVCKLEDGSMKIQPHLVAALARDFDTLIIDESSNVGNWHSLNFKVVRTLAALMDYVYELTGTPVNTDVQALWPQFTVLDGGETMGRTLGFFRQAFMKKVKLPWGIEWKLRKDREEALHRRTRHLSVRFKQEECLDLPPCIGGIDNPHIRRVPPTAEQLAAHDECRQLVKDAFEAGTRLPVVYHRLRAISSGYRADKGPDGVYTYHHFDKNPKLEALISTIRELGGQKFIVFVHLHRTRELVSARLRKEKISYAELHGRTKNKEKELRAFQGKAQVLVATKAAAYGLNLQFCRYTGFYETPDSTSDRRQAERRTHRPGSSGTVHLIDFVVTGLVDDKILTALKAGKRVQDVVVDGLKE